MSFTIETECGCYTTRHGFFDEPDECPEVITQEFEEEFGEAIEIYDFKTSDGEPPDEEDEFTICYAVECPACKAILEWPQMWMVV